MVLHPIYTSSLSCYLLGCFHVTRAPDDTLIPHQRSPDLAERRDGQLALLEECLGGVPRYERGQVGLQRAELLHVVLSLLAAHGPHVHLVLGGVSVRGLSLGGQQLAVLVRVWRPRVERYRGVARCLRLLGSRVTPF